MSLNRSSIEALAKFCLLVTVMAASSATVSAATVRGRVGCAVQGGRQGAVNGKYVTVFNANIGRSKQASVGADGMFYLYNIPANSYVLEVWSRSNPSLPPQTFQLKVLEPYTNVPAITVSC
jgi:hypothetical protein